MSNLVKFGSYEQSAAHEEKADLEAGGGADFLKLKQGRNVVRILPPPLGKRSPFRTVYQHFIQLPSGPAVFVCPRLEARSPCPACAKAESLRGSRNEEDQRLAGELFARRRVFCNAVDRASPEDGPKVLAFGKLVHEQLVSLREDEDAGGEYTHPITGFDIVISRSGTTKNDTKYTVSAARQASQLHDDAAVMQEWIDNQRDLETFARVASLDEIRDLMAGKKRERGGAHQGPATSAAPRAPRGRTVGDDVGE